MSIETVEQTAERDQSSQVVVSECDYPSQYASQLPVEIVAERDSSSQSTSHLPVSSVSIRHTLNSLHSQVDAIMRADTIESVFAEDARVFHDRDICQTPYCKDCKALNTR